MLTCGSPQLRISNELVTIDTPSEPVGGEPTPKPPPGRPLTKLLASGLRSPLLPFALAPFQPTGPMPPGPVPLMPPGPNTPGSPLPLTPPGPKTPGLDG